MENEPQALAQPSPNNTVHLQTGTPKISEYEQCREERIKQNLQRMQQLGLKALSNSLLNSNPRLSSRRGRPPTHGTKTPVRPRTPPLPQSVRRSSRLQNTPPVIYTETVRTKKEEILEDLELKLEKSEFYTEEHEKLLGNTERSWTLFVDGYASDGRRIYDSFKGKTCHQCRQKTLGHRTHCSKCNMVQGQFCGDCLYMRYGEHVLEANEDPNWVCPVCRGICNCSLCRQAKGWAPTGPLYKKIAKMGFKSVAHYLIQTRRLQTDVKKNLDNTDQVSAKRSLSFPAPEMSSEESSELIISVPQTGEDGLSDEKKEYNVAEPNTSVIHQNPESRALLCSKTETEFEKGESKEINLVDAHEQLEFSEPESGNKIHEKELDFIEPPDSIAGRLIRRRYGNDSSHDETMGVNDEDGAGKNADESYTASQKLTKRPATVVTDEAAENTSSCNESKANSKHSTSGTNMDCVARRLRPRNKAL